MLMEKINVSIIDKPVLHCQFIIPLFANLFPHSASSMVSCSTFPCYVDYIIQILSIRNTLVLQSYPEINKKHFQHIQELKMFVCFLMEAIQKLVNALIQFSSLFLEFINLAVLAQECYDSCTILSCFTPLQRGESYQGFGGYSNELGEGPGLLAKKQVFICSVKNEMLSMFQSSISNHYDFLALHHLS